MLGENCPVTTPIPEDSGMSLNKQSDTLSQNQNLIQPDPSVEIVSCAESLQQPSAPTAKGDVAEGNHSKESSDSDSVAVSESGSCSDSGSHSESGTGSVISLEESGIPYPSFEGNLI